MSNETRVIRETDRTDNERIFGPSFSRHGLKWRPGDFSEEPEGTGSFSVYL